MGHLRILIVLMLFVVPCAAQQTVFVPTCAGVNDNARFIAIKSTVGTSTPVAIRLPAKKICKLTASLTLTSNITLVGTDGGQIDLTNNSVTLTIQGPVDLPARQVFLNATAGLGTVSFSGNKSIPVYYPQWFGVTGDGSTDDTAAFTAALVATPNGAVFQINPGLIIKITSTITLTERKALTITSGVDARN